MCQSTLVSKSKNICVAIDHALCSFLKALPGSLWNYKQQLNQQGNMKRGIGVRINVKQRVAVPTANCVIQSEGLLRPVAYPKKLYAR